MSVNRRDFIKMLAVLSGSALLSNQLIAGQKPDSASYTYFLLHGMFFMEFDGDKLIVATPNFEGHRFYTRLHGGNLQDMPKDIDLYNNLGSGKTTCFDPRILQFSRCNALGITDPVLSQASMYRCKMILPQPVKIIPLRLGNSVQYSTNGIKPKLKIGKEIATITCLAYGAGDNDPYIQSYYAEHPHKPSLYEVNMALEAAQDLCGDKFQLQMASLGNPICIDPKEIASVGNGVSIDDEDELQELSPSHPYVCNAPPPVLSCMQSKSKNSAKPGLTHVDVASCPQFAITP